MNENQRKWLLTLQSKGVRFEYCDINDEWLNDWKCTFSASQKKYRIPAQPMPDIPDWRELCGEMQSKGVQFEMVFDLDRELVINPGEYSDAPRLRRYHNGFSFTDAHISCFRIPQQPIPEWREEMTEETKPDPREEIPHRELQIQWHEDMLHHLRTGEPMREWQWRKLGGAWQWLGTASSTWNRCFYYRRKPRTVTYWHCVGVYIGYQDNGVVDREVFSSDCSASDVQSQIDTCKENYPSAKFSPITETTVEVED